MRPPHPIAKNTLSPPEANASLKSLPLQAPALIPSPPSPVTQQGECVHLVIPGETAPEPTLTARPRRWSEGWRRRIVGCDSAVWACRAAIAATPNLRHRVYIVGGNRAGDRAAALGLAFTGRLSPPFARPELATAAIKNLFAEHGEPDIIQCWGGSFAALRDRLAGHTRRAVWLVTDFEGAVLEIKEPGAREPLTQALSPWLSESGGGGPLHHRDDIRRQLRVGTDDLLIALVGDPASAVDALPLMSMISILHVAGIRAIPVLPRSGFAVPRVLRHLRTGGYISDVRVVGCVSLVATACDIGVCIPRLPAEGEASVEPRATNKLAVGHVAARGLPVLIPESVWARSLYPAAAHTCIYPTLDHAAIAKTVVPMLENGRAGLHAARAAILESGLAPAPRSLTDEVVAAWGTILATSARRR